MPLARSDRILFVSCTPAYHPSKTRASVPLSIFMAACRSMLRCSFADATAAIQPSRADTTQMLRIFCAHFRILAFISLSSSTVSRH